MLHFRAHKSLDVIQSHMDPLQILKHALIKTNCSISLSRTER
jgi:hypothetical protein